MHAQILRIGGVLGDGDAPQNELRKLRPDCVWATDIAAVGTQRYALPGPPDDRACFGTTRDLMGLCPMPELRKFKVQPRIKRESERIQAACLYRVIRTMRELRKFKLHVLNDGTSLGPYANRNDSSCMF